MSLALKHKLRLLAHSLKSKAMIVGNISKITKLDFECSFILNNNVI